ncbi:MAG: hypothetical protein HQK52_21160 [Oligoflexia bacterium]|nr:hypothetical protein [Oligoflexia bacterium]
MIILLMLLNANIGFAREILRVKSISGKVFASFNEKTWILEEGASIDDLTEVLTEESAAITFSDLEGRRYHLSGATHVKFMNRLVELRKGHVWVELVTSPTEIRNLSPEDFDKRKDLEIHTANAIAKCSRGEFILSYDYPQIDEEGRTQLLCISGECSFGNLIQNDYKVKLTAGQFSFVSKDYDEGMPRNGTPVGFDSYKSVLTLFREVPGFRGHRQETMENLKNPEKASRSIASEGFRASEVKIKSTLHEHGPAREGNSSTPSGSSDGKVIKIPYEKREHAKHFNLEEYYNQTLREIPKPKPKKRSIFANTTNTVVKVFGRSGGQGKASRMPSSAVGQKQKQASDHQDYYSERRHKNEVTRLLNDLSNAPSNDPSETR